MDSRYRFRAFPTIDPREGRAESPPRDHLEDSPGVDLAPFSNRPVEPLRKTTADGTLLRRPAKVESQIAEILVSGGDEVRRRAAVDKPDDPRYLLPECLVHLVRVAVREGRHGWVDELTPRLLGRCERSLRRSIAGLDAVGREEALEDVLGRLAVLLVDPGDGADFFEVRFDLALKRLRIDVCRQVRRRREPLVAFDGFDDDERSGDPGLDRLADQIDVDALPAGLDAEQEASLRQALGRLTEVERRTLVLHRLVGVPLASKKPGVRTLVEILGVSERTVRNYLRRAESKISGRTEDGP